MNKKYIFISSLVLMLFSQFSQAQQIEELSIQHVVLKGSQLISAQVVDQYSEELCLIENIVIGKTSTFAECGIFDAFVSITGSFLHIQVAEQGEADEFARGITNIKNPSDASTKQSFDSLREEKIREIQNDNSLSNWEKWEYTKALSKFPIGPKI